jgi:hypothetical protein
VKVIAMTSTQTRRPVTRWLATPIRALRHLNEELTGAGGAIAGSNRFPQPGPRAGLDEAPPARPAPAAQVLMGV